jgi:Gluconate 2-dehydrogenase subunit 3
VGGGFRDAGHLPQLREGDMPGDPEGLPRHRNGITPQMRGRYPNYNVLDNADHWDAATREVVLGRIEQVPPIRFFTPAEEPTIRAFCDCVTAQDSEPRIPLANFVDEKLYEGRLDGFQLDGMPDDRDTWRLVAAGLDEAARELFSIESFAACPLDVQHQICSRFANGELEGGVWESLDQSNAWGVVMRGVLQSFYSHPWAWNEIGFGGPAYPRDYSRLGDGMREAWEGEEAFELDPVRDVDERGLE